MFLSNLSIKRPVFATMMMVALMTLGMFSYRRLAIDLYPDVEFPILSIITVYPGASPETVEREVSKRIEEAVNPIPGVKRVLSSSREGLSNVMVMFQLEIKINEASQEARAKVNAIRGELPRQIEDPVIQKMDIATMPVISLAVRSERLLPREISTLADRKIKRRLERIAGVGKVELVGESKREVQVHLNPERLNSLGMGVDEVIAGLQSENVNTPLGRMTGKSTEVSLRISGKPDAVGEFEKMVIARRQERPILLGDVARVEDGQEEQRSLALVNGIPAIALEVLKQSKANVVGVADAVKKEIQSLQKEMPAGTIIEVVQDSSGFIQESVADVQETIVIGGFLTILIVFCFLNSWRSTVITGLTLPISVISAFVAIYFLNMTINVMTLMALSLAIGLLIDDAIVVRENIVRHLEQGQDHYTAARDGTTEIGLAVLATTLSIVAVFVPVAFMKGIMGRFFFQFGITVTFAVLVSLFVSFTLDPMLSSRWYDPDVEGKGRRNLLARMLDRFNHWFDRTANQYRVVIDWSLRHRPTVVFLAALAFAGGLMAFFSVETSFFPNADQGEFQIKFKAAPDASVAESRNRLEAILAAVKDIPEIHHTYATVGAGETSTIRDGRVYIKLTDRKERLRHQERVRVDIRSRLSAIPGIIPSVEQAADNFSQKPIQVNIRGEEIPLLKKYSAQLKTIMAGIPGIVDLDASMEQDTPEYRLVIDRKRASDVGLMTAQVVQTLSALVGGQAVSTFEDEAGEAIDVRVRLPQEQRQDLTAISNLRFSLLRPEEGVDLIPLNEIARYQASITPSEINRQNMTREVVVSANLDNLALGTAMNRIQRASGQISMNPGYAIVFSGEAEDMVESFGYMAEALFLAVIFVYLILASQFESFVDPLAIMLSLPLSIVGMAGLLYMTGDTLNIMSLIGLIMLMGLVTKNAILLVDYAKVLQRRGYSRHDAVVLAGRTRLRPIMMTTLAMIFGMLPLALALGAGGEMRAPMARAVIGGLITSTMLTLLVVPVVYTLLDDLVQKFQFHRPHEVEVEK